MRRPVGNVCISGARNQLMRKAEKGKKDGRTEGKKEERWEGSFVPSCPSYPSCLESEYEEQIDARRLRPLKRVRLQGALREGRDEAEKPGEAILERDRTAVSADFLLHADVDARPDGAAD